MNRFSLFLLSCLTLLFMGCSNGKRAEYTVDKLPDIFPDYKNISVPCNIAPLNFKVYGATSLYAEFSCKEKQLFSLSGKDEIDIPLKDWEKALCFIKGDTIKIELSVFNSEYPDGVRYKPFSIYISKDSIDKYIAYRLIEPGYESWQDMRICQRCLSDFHEEEILKTDRGACINCHSFNNFSSKQMLIHYRKKGGGTLLVDNGKLKKVDFKSLPPGKQGVYPMWHPSGKYVIFSSNSTVQSFYITGKSPIEVYDDSSDLILYDVKENRVLTDNRFCGDSLLQTFPAWSGDGKSLYYCVSRPVENSDSIKCLHYSLCRVGFNVEKGSFDAKVDTIINAEKEKCSVSFPRISLDGHYLLYTKSSFATFPIWHPESQLEMIDLFSGANVNVDILNSPEADSYHSWSSNGKWIVFCSRRLDGRYTRLFISHFDGKGHFSCPFLLPQSSPEHNVTRLESYNIPEFVNAPVKLDKKRVMELFK